GHTAAPYPMTLAAEMIVPAEVEDDFGRPARPTITFLRYELEIGYNPPGGLERVRGATLPPERRTHINRSDAARHLRFPHGVKNFRNEVVVGRRGGTAFIS